MASRPDKSASRPAWEKDSAVSWLTINTSSTWPEAIRFSSAS